MGVPNTQRRYKDKLFVSLFRKKEELLALYNAVSIPALMSLLSGHRKPQIRF